MNAFGKNLVLAHTALAMLFMTWAVMVYMQFNDFGWKDPYKIWDTKDSGRRVASQLDKRTAFLHELYRQKDRALPGIKPAIDSLTETMEFFPKNRQFYVAELEKIRESDEPINPKQLTWKDGELVLDTPGKGLGKPLMKAPIGGIDKSTKSITKERADVLIEIEKITPDLTELVGKADEITVQLYGTKDDKGNSVEIGLYEILDNETTLQDKIREEKEYLTPRYVEAQRRADSFRDRFGGMKKTLTQVNRPK